MPSPKPIIRMFATTIYNRTYVISKINFDTHIITLWTETGKEAVPYNWIKSFKFEAPHHTLTGQ